MVLLKILSDNVDPAEMHNEEFTNLFYAWIITCSHTIRLMKFYFISVVTKKASIKSLLKLDIFWPTGWDRELEKQVAEELWRMLHNFQVRECHKRFRTLKESQSVSILTNIIGMISVR